LPLKDSLAAEIQGYPPFSQGLTGQQASGTTIEHAKKTKELDLRELNFYEPVDLPAGCGSGKFIASGWQLESTIGGTCTPGEPVPSTK
jgi:hypothetical protein